MLPLTWLGNLGSTDPRAQKFIAHMEIARGREAQGRDGEGGHHLWV